MAHILHLDTSPRGEASHSRQITAEFVQAWLSAYPADTVVTRDLGHQAIPHVSEEFIGAMYTPAEQRTPAQTTALSLSDTLIGELFVADIYVFGIPMYNFGVPSVFKAYIDQIARAGVTFNPATYEGLLKNKKMFVVTARGGGGYGPGENHESLNVQEPSIRTAFGLMGVSDIEFIHLNNLMPGDGIKDAALANARREIDTATSAQKTT